MREYLQHIIMWTIFVLLLIWFFWFSSYTNSLSDERELLIEEQKRIEKEIDKMLKWKSIQKINNSYEMIHKYFKERSDLMMRELFVFLEYVYPSNSNVETLDIKKEKWKSIQIKLVFYTKKIENIRRLYTRLMFFKNKWIITEFSLWTTELQTDVQVWRNWLPVNVKYYTLDFTLTPNYELIRDFIYKKTKENNKEMYKALYENWYIMLYENFKEKEKKTTKNKRKKKTEEKEE